MNNTSCQIYNCNLLPSVYYARVGGYEIVSHNLKKLLYILILITFLTNCSSVRKATASEKITELKNNNLSEFNGIYSNKPLNREAEIFSLWATLNFRAERYENWSDLKVRLKTNSKNQIIAELINGNEIIATKLLKGKIENGFYRIKNQFNSDFKYIIVWVLGDSSVKVGITENKELIVLRESGGTAFLVAFPVFASDTPFIETKHKRTE